MRHEFRDLGSSDLLLPTAPSALSGCGAQPHRTAPQRDAVAQICDVWDEEHASMLAEYGEDFADGHRFQVPEGCNWPNVRAAPKNVGTALANAMQDVETANQEHLYSVFGDAQWTNKARLPDELLKDLVEHFWTLSLGDAHVASDVTSDAYEYLLKQFADAANKNVGEFYTPRSVVRLVVDILDPEKARPSTTPRAEPAA